MHNVHEFSSPMMNEPSYGGVDMSLEIPIKEAGHIS